jgi:hypothetical protein
MSMRPAKFLLVAMMVVPAVLPGVAQQSIPDPASAQPIIIPPAITGLIAGSEELQRALDETILPHSVPDLLAELAKRANDIGQTIASGALGQVWVPAMGTKTVALVLESRTAELTDRPRAAATMAIKRIVTSAWELDAYGDLGNKPKLDEAYKRLASAVSDLKAAYAPR